MNTEIPTTSTGAGIYSINSMLCKLYIYIYMILYVCIKNFLLQGSRVCKVFSRPEWLKKSSSSLHTIPSANTGTSPKINMEPENHPIWKGNSYSTPSFLGSILIFGGCTSRNELLHQKKLPVWSPKETRSPIRGSPSWECRFFKNAMAQQPQRPQTNTTKQQQNETNKRHKPMQWQEKMT